MRRIFDLLLASAIMVFFSGSNFYYIFLGIDPEMTDDEIAAFEGAITNIFFICYALIIILVMVNWRSVLKGTLSLWPYGVLIVLAWLSLFWTIDVEVTLRRCVALTMTYLYGVVLFARFDFDEIMTIIMVGLGITMLGSLVAVVALPEFAVHGEGDHAGAWRGLYVQKNGAGRAMIWLLIAIIAAWLAGTTNRLILVLMGLLTLVLIVGTTSKTAMLGLAVMLMVGPAMRVARGPALGSAVITFTALAIIWHAGVLVAFTYEDILVSMGRDPTLTGRTEIWRFTLGLLEQRWLTGFGYEAFWASDFGPGGRYRVDWGIASAHNAWIEIMLNLGPLGALIMLAIVLQCAYRGVILARYSTNRGAAFFVASVLLVTTTVSMSEAIFVERHSIHTIIFMVCMGIAGALTERLWSPAADPQLAAAPTMQSKTV